MDPRKAARSRTESQTPVFGEKESHSKEEVPHLRRASTFDSSQETPMTSHSKGKEKSRPQPTVEPYSNFINSLVKMEARDGADESRKKDQERKVTQRGTEQRTNSSCQSSSNLAAATSKSGSSKTSLQTEAMELSVLRAQLSEKDSAIESI